MLRKALRMQYFVALVFSLLIELFEIFFFFFLQFSLHEWYTAEGFSDNKLFWEVLLNHGKESICIFDCGLQKRATFEEFIKEGIHFIVWFITPDAITVNPRGVVSTLSAWFMSTSTSELTSHVSFIIGDSFSILILVLPNSCLNSFFTCCVYNSCS
jgi:hypothetical protein